MPTLSSAPRPASTSADAAQQLAPQEIVHRAIETYRQALGYSDRGIVRLSYKEQGQRLEDTAPLEVEYAMPNRLRVRAYQAEIVSDGKEVLARIEDALTNNLDGQIVRRPAPKKLTLDDLYADTVLHDVLQSGLGRHPAQLELLLGDAPLLDLVKPDAQLALADPVEIEGHPCYRVQAQLADGIYTFAFDQKEFLLRRIEYPAANMLPDVAANPAVSDLSIVAEFRDARFVSSLPDDRFVMHRLPENRHEVRYFVLPPQELPSQLFGHKPGAFQLTTPAGDKLASSDFEGKIVALMWFSHDPACAAGLQQLSEALAKSNAGDKVAAYVVATEDDSLPSETIAATLQEWQVEVPLLRDFELVGRDTFAIRNAPTLVVLGPTGEVQIFEEGVNPRLSQTLPVVIQRLQAGDDLAGEILADARKAQEQYAQNLAAASDASAQTAVVELPPAKIADRRDPEHFTLQQLWSTAEKELVEPGNFLVIPGQDGSRVFVLDGYRTVVELGADGKVATRHTPELPERAGMTYLRSAASGDGKRYFVGSALLGSQLYLFDENWKTLMRYPPDDQEHEGLHAVEIADLAGDGTPELYVGFWSLIGVQGVTLEGKREWTNRVLPTVLSLVATPANDVGWRKLIATGDRGALYRLNQYGHHDPKLEIPGRQIHRLAAASWPSSEATTYCGLSFQPDGHLLALGLDADLAEVWNYKLPAGQFNSQIEIVTSGPLRNENAADWILAAPDGSIHIVSSDGEFSDSFALGEALSGLATAQLGETRVILTATKGKVTAWKLAPRAE